jgi:hypothetical protein
LDWHHVIREFLAALTHDDDAQKDKVFLLERATRIGEWSGYQAEEVISMNRLLMTDTENATGFFIFVLLNR